MAFALPSRTKTLNVLETLAIGAVGGALFLWAHLPGGLISGAMIAVGIAAIAGRPLAVPPIVTQAVLVLLGISLGSLVSRQFMQHISAYPLTIALLALATFCSTFGSSVYLQRFHGWDRTSAFLAGSPGALSQITILAAREGRRRAGDRGGADHARDHPHRCAADAAGADRARAGVLADATAAIASPLELTELVAASVAVSLLAAADQNFRRAGCSAR